MYVIGKFEILATRERECAFGEVAGLSSSFSWAPNELEKEDRRLS